MYSQVLSSALLGVEPHFVQVEVDLSPGLPGFHIVGLPDASVGESAHRVRSALRAITHPLPPKRCTVNLAPGDLRKEGPRFDLAIALGILAASQVFAPEKLDRSVILGELCLDGKVNPVRGTVSTALAMAGAGLRRLFVPSLNAAEVAGLLPDLEVFPVESLGQLLLWLQGKTDQIPDIPTLRAATLPPYPDLSQVSGQPMGCKALTIAAAGGHHLLWFGPPGCGKTLLSRCLPGLMPDLTESEALEVARLRSSLGERARPSTTVPFCQPHSGITAVGLLGGHSPGEISRAHNGVLFLDEITEFSRDCLEGLRVALEQGTMEVGRARQRYRYPARIQLLAACNPCPCGQFGVPDRICTCTASRRRTYMSRLSGPIRDRLDLQIHLLRPDPQDTWKRGSETTAEARQRVLLARERQRRRGSINRELRREHFLRRAEVTKGAWEMLYGYASCFQLSARAMERVLRVSRTLADLQDVGSISSEHVAEAVHYRCLDRWEEQTAAQEAV